MVPTQDHIIYETEEPLFLELHAVAMLCLSSGECMTPDATLCATLMSALYSSVSEEQVLNRQLMVCSYPFWTYIIDNKRCEDTFFTVCAWMFNMLYAFV